MLTPQDPNGAKLISAQASESALPDNQIGSDGAANANTAGFSDGVHQSYASSVEMVTSPDDWPIWKTRKPVIISLRHHHGRVEHHRYRYMVVTPGAHGESDEMDGGDETTVEGTSIGGSTTQDDANASSEVMKWENPFRESQVSVSAPTLNM